MLCKVCGRSTTNETANFCEYCGASFREGAFVGIPDSTYNHAQSSQEKELNKNIVTGNDEVGDKPMSFGNWMMVLMLPFVPVVGSFIYFGVLIVWAFGHKASKTKKNWARATLVMLVVAFIMFFAYFNNVSGLLGGI